MAEPGDTIIARFAPKRLETLRPCMRPFIGRVFQWRYLWTADEDETYAGQDCWAMDYKHEVELPDDVIGRWCPDEDLERV